jgi:hypothetical protein
VHALGQGPELELLAIKLRIRHGYDSLGQR